MAWIESHQELGSHPKTLKLARLLAISKPTAIGHLHCFWWWAMDYAQDGDLSRYDELDIAIGGEWDREPSVFVDALVRAGFLDCDDAGLRVHDWDEYAGRLLEKRRHDAERKRTARRFHRTSNGRGADVRETARVTVPNLTVPNLTGPNQEAGSAHAREDGADAPPPPQEPPDVSSNPKSTRRKPMRPWPSEWGDGDPPAEMVAIGTKQGLTPETVPRSWSRFRSYAFASDKRYADWPHAWRNWAQGDAERAPPSGITPIRPAYRARAPVEGNLTDAELLALARGESP